jgi:hypothetical protein
MAVMLTGGVLFVVLARVIWIDFLLVTLLVLLHPSVEKALHGLLPRHA